MKILISTAVLAEALNKLEDMNIYNVLLEDGQLVINNQTEVVQKIHVEVLEFRPSVIQENAHWDALKRLMNAVSDQPIVLIFQKNSVQALFQY